MASETVELVFFVLVDGLSEEDAESARQANRATLALGVEGQKCAYAGPITEEYGAALAASFLRLQGLMEFVEPWGVEAYDNGAMNIALCRSGTNRNIGFIRVRPTY